MIKTFSNREKINYVGRMDGFEKDLKMEEVSINGAKFKYIYNICILEPS